MYLIWSERPLLLSNIRPDLTPQTLRQDGEYDKDGCEFEEDEDMAEAEGEQEDAPAAVPAADQPPSQVRLCCRRL